MQNKNAYVDTFFKNAVTCNNDNNDNNDNNLNASALIQEDPNLISIDGSMHIKNASISWHRRKTLATPSRSSNGSAMARGRKGGAGGGGS